MPVAKNGLTRYRIIDACLTNKRKPYPSLEELKAAMAKEDIHVESRSIERDFEEMRHNRRLGYLAPIAYSNKHRGYYYTDPEYSIEKLPLTTEEIEAFSLIVESFKRFRGAEVLNQVAGMFDKLEKVVVKQLKPKATQSPVVDFEKMPYSKGIEHFDKLYQSIIRQQPLQVRYKGFDKPASEHVFHPYLLKEYKFRWYVLGYSETRRSKLIFALDRIENISTKKIAFRPQRGAEVQQYFDHTLGVTTNAGGVKEIRLWFSEAQGHYIKTQYLHTTQKIEKDDHGGLIILSSPEIGLHIS